jgi:hypothetical protein
MRTYFDLRFNACFVQKCSLILASPPDFQCLHSSDTIDGKRVLDLAAFCYQ